MLKPVNIMWSIQQPNTRKVDGNYTFTSIQQLYIYQYSGRSKTVPYSALIY